MDSLRIAPDLRKTVAKWRVAVYAAATVAMASAFVVIRGGRAAAAAALFAAILALSLPRLARIALSIERLLLLDLAVAVAVWWLYGPISGAAMITLAVVAVAPLLLDRTHARSLVGVALVTVPLETGLHFLAGSIALPLFHPPDPVPTSEFIVGEIIKASLLVGVGILMVAVAEMLRRGQRALAADLEREREFSRLKDRFVATVSHQLRTPLTALKGFARTLLEDDVGPDDRAEFLAIMADQAEELHGHIEDLIIFSRLEAGGVTIRPVLVDFHRLTAESIETLGGTARALVESKVPANLSAWVDPPRVRQVIRNLVDNALEHGRPPIEITASTSASAIHCRVLDSGLGISHADTSRVFEPYARLVDDPTMSLPGLGLGLPVVRGLVAAHGGTIRVVSVDDMNGLEFTLPAVPTETMHSGSLSDRQPLV